MSIEAHAPNIQRFAEAVSEDAPILQRILSFTHLPEGWYFGAGHPPTGDTIASAITIAHTLRDIGAKPLEAFPDADGSILIIGYRGGDESVEILTHAGGRFDFAYEKGEDLVESLPGLNLHQARQKIRALMWQAESLFGYFIHSTLAQRSAVTSALLSKTPPMEGSQLSMANVFTQQASLYANILSSTTQWQLQETRQSSGDLTKTYFLREAA
jgi:hypothetical protein